MKSFFSANLQRKCLNKQSNAQLTKEYWHHRNLLFFIFCFVLIIFTACRVDGNTPCLDQSGDFPAPETCPAENGELITDLYVQFAQANLSGATDNTGTPISEIWTRAYSSSPADPDNPLNEIPGPTYIFHPGDWLQITLHNQLNQLANPWLKDFQDNIPSNSQDDIEELIPHELNIPHNANNTNLHVHGLHVDPQEDNVTILIIPEDDDPSNYSPELQQLIPNIDRWWEWEYGYRIPKDHLPGTYWYHAHKHGATSTHVENGMAGSLVIQPVNDDDAIVPGLWSADPSENHDRVMVLQEIANYGIQQGLSASRTISNTNEASVNDQYTTEWPNIMVNGQHQPTLTIAPGQTERWRFIDAGANHRTATYLWVGELILPDALPDNLRNQLEPITDFETAKPYITIGGNAPAFSSTLQIGIGSFPGSAQLVAIDGVTLHEAVDVGPDNPVLLGPGNRADLFIQPNANTNGTYYVGKNFNIAPPLEILAEHPNYGSLFQGDAGFWRYQALTTYVGNANGTNVVNGTGTPYGNDWAPVTNFLNLSLDPFALNANFNGFQQQWPSKVNVDGSIQGETTKLTSLAPLIKGQANGTLVSAVPVSGEDYTFPGLGWVPTGGGPPSLVDSQVLITLNVEGNAVTNGPEMPTNARLNQLSPTTTDAANTLLNKVDADGNLVQGIPSYVAPITDDDIVGQQVIVFDRSGIKFNYQPPEGGPTTGINQFSLNGRQFSLMDFVGNSMATTLIQSPVPDTIYDDFNADQIVGTYNFIGAGNYSNQVTVGDQTMALFTNPGYYLPVVEIDDYFTYDYENASTFPDYTMVTGLDAPNQPMATTAEEWLLVNNSRIFHPFHIHISPFLVTEVGQMNYDGTSSTWEINKLSPDDPLGYILNNWWDVIIIPPQGYVKVRLWMNVPDQKPSDPTDPDSPITVADNANVFGSWVYHCHILRHEDRGMMMIVSVKPNPKAN